MPGLGACECLVWAPANAWFGRLRMPGLGACECLVWAPANAWFGRLRMPGLGACECLVWAPANAWFGRLRMPRLGACVWLVWAPANAWFGRLLQMRWVTAGVIPRVRSSRACRGIATVLRLHPSLDKLGMTMPSLCACERLICARANAWFGRLRMPGLGACECLVWAPATDAVGNRRRHPEYGHPELVEGSPRACGIAPVPRQARDDNAWFGRLRMPGLGACECLVWGACDCLVWAPAIAGFGGPRMLGLGA